MSFNLEKLFVDVFAPRAGDLVTLLYDEPHDDIPDHTEWQSRREMARDWHRQIESFADRYEIELNPLVTFPATGAHNADLPQYGQVEGEPAGIEDMIANSTIVVAMTEFSATAPLMQLAKRYPQVRAASMPGVTRTMEKTALTADYSQVAATCARLAPLFKNADGVEVHFSSGQQCYFDLSNHSRVFEDSGLLPPDLGAEGDRLANLPAGEVCACPNEAPSSRTSGELPAVIEDESVVFVVNSNRVVDVLGDGPVAKRMRGEFQAEKALGNIAEVAIGCNDKAVVTGNVLEDEKAGFHWAYGRSDHLGGTTGVDSFSSPQKVQHQDIVYARGNPIVCSRLEFVFPDGKKQTAIVDGKLVL